MTEKKNREFTITEKTNKEFTMTAISSRRFSNSPWGHLAAGASNASLCHAFYQPISSSDVLLLPYVRRVKLSLHVKFSASVTTKQNKDASDYKYNPPIIFPSTLFYFFLQKLKGKRTKRRTHTHKDSSNYFSFALKSIFFSPDRKFDRDVTPDTATERHWYVH